MSDAVLWIDPSFGASGDMFLGALSGLVGNTDSLVEGLASLKLDGYAISSEAVTRAGISANRVKVDTEESTTARHWSEIDAMLAGSDLPDAVRTGARATFHRLGLVEAQQHQVSLEEVHFHEVGALDAIIDIVGTWILLDQLNIDKIIVGPVGLGHGTVKAAHGVLPLPAPATAALLLGMPVRGIDTATETCTPTGAALLAELASVSGQMPAGTIEAISRGAGGRDPASHPNVLSMFLLDPSDSPTTSGSPTGSIESNLQDSVMLATNLDDVTPEVLANTIQVLLDAGADDAWLVPIIMKKGRPAHELRILCSPLLAADLCAVIFRETGTLGIREYPVHKHVLPRDFTTIEVRGHPVAMKVGPFGAKPEHDDLVRIADATGQPIRLLALEAHAAFAALVSPSHRPCD